MVVHQNTKTQIQMVAPFGNGLFWIQSLKPRSNFLSSFTGLGVRMTGCQVLMTATRLQIGAAESTCILTCRQIISHLTQSLQMFLSDLFRSTPTYPFIRWTHWTQTLRKAETASIAIGRPYKLCFLVQRPVARDSDQKVNVQQFHGFQEWQWGSWKADQYQKLEATERGAWFP